MIDHTLILGAEIGRNSLKISCFPVNQNEMTNENRYFDDNDADEVIGKELEDYINLQENLEKDQIILVFSCDDGQIPLVKSVEQKLTAHGMSKNHFRVISRENAFLHYILNQEESIRQHGVLLFDFDGSELWVYRMHHSKKKMPLNYKAEKSLLGTFSFSGERKDWGRIFDDKFAGIARQILSKEVVSAVYLTGEGFEGGWLKKSLRILCDGRRAFMGQNLFSAGCCFYGRTLDEPDSKDYMIQAPETVLYESGVFDGTNQDTFVPITEAGNAWYETKGSLDVILERAGKVDITFVHSITKEKQVESVDISSLPPRPRKTGRLHVEIQFFDSKTGVITVCDKGFGEFLPATCQVFLKEFTLL